MSPTEQVWAHHVPDGVERAAWLREWGAGGDQYARPWVRGFPGQPRLARAWLLSGVNAGDAIYLHSLGVAPPHAEAMDEHYRAALAEIRDRAAPYNAEYRLRACLLLAHPDLTREDRDTIAAAVLHARIDRAEISHAITTGTYDRDTLTLLGALR